MKIYKNTGSEVLWEVLEKLMSLEELNSFRLVGGTALSLLIGHRVSEDLDLFTDAEYGTIDFDKILDAIKSVFSYVEIGMWSNTTTGNTCYIGPDEEHIVKLDLFYTDSFVFPVLNFEHVRLSQMEEIAAMKLEMIGKGGRKKDFWDIHALTQCFSLQQMIQFYLKRYPFGHTKDEILSQLTNFTEADDDFNPKCLKGKHWELVKLDFEEMVN